MKPTPTKRSAKARKIVKTAPEEIWLQWNGDQEPDDDAEKHEVTWAANQIFTHDVRYVLPAAPEDVERMHDTIKIAMDVEDNTGSGMDWAAWRVMHRLGLTDLTWLRFYKTHIDKRPATPTKKTKAL